MKGLVPTQFLCMARTEGRDRWPTRGECIRVCPVPLGRKRHLTERLRLSGPGKTSAPAEKADSPRGLPLLRA